MADNDYNIIKPIESLKNITGLTPAKRREERKRRQNLPAENKEKGKQQMNESVDQQNHKNKLNNDENDQHSIDYRV